MNVDTIGRVPRAVRRRTTVTVPRVLLVLGGAAVGTWVGFRVGGPVGAAVGALVGSFVGSLAAGLIKKLTVTIHPDGRVVVQYETVFA